MKMNRSAKNNNFSLIYPFASEYQLFSLENTGSKTSFDHFFDRNMIK